MSDVWDMSQEATWLVSTLDDDAMFAGGGEVPAHMESDTRPAITTSAVRTLVAWWGGTD